MTQSWGLKKVPTIGFDYVVCTNPKLGPQGGTNLWAQLISLYNRNDPKLGPPRGTNYWIRLSFAPTPKLGPQRGTHLWTQLTSLQRPKIWGLSKDTSYWTDL